MRLDPEYRLGVVCHFRAEFPGSRDNAPLESLQELQHSIQNLFQKSSSSNVPSKSPPNQSWYL